MHDDLCSDSNGWQIQISISINSTTVQSMMCANNWVHYGLKISSVCLHLTLSYYHQYADPSENIEYIKCLPGVFCSVFFSDQVYIISYLVMKYMWLCVCSALLMTVRKCVFNHIITIKSDMWNVSYCLGLNYETMICAVCFAIFLWICDMARLLRTTCNVLTFLLWIFPPVTDIQHDYLDNSNDRTCAI